MKEIDIYIRSDDLSKVTDILQKYKVGMTFFDIFGTGRTPRAAQKIVDVYMTGKTNIPKFVKRTNVKTIVPDASAKQIVDDLLNSFGSAVEPYGLMFIKDVSDAYEIGSKLSGDAVLTLK
ncbi:MAG TPA: P-II family nitrogen regulator [Nitrososphaeraceae archaeon]|nr:P-II family nitrogen regulator [Nitrososphaeraceae archaeon]